MPNSAAPTLLSATPADNTGAVPLGANIVLTFSAAVIKGSGTITISDGASQTYIGRDGLLHTRLVGATDTRTISIGDSSQVTVSGNTVTINLAADLKPGLNYSVQMGRDVLRNEAGTFWSGLSDATKLNFTTVSPVSMAGEAPDLHTGSDFGVSDSDNLTNDRQPVISVNLSGKTGLVAGNTIEIRDLSDGGALVGVYTLTADDFDSYGVLEFNSKDIALNHQDHALSDGAHDLVVQIGDLAGTAPGAASDALTVVIDTAAPTASIDTNLNFFGLTVPTTVSGSYGGTLGGDEFIEYSFDGGTTWAQAAVSGDDWTTASVTLGTQGSTIGLRVGDTAGNLGDNGVNGAHTVFIGDGYGGAFNADGGTVLYAKAGDDTINMAGVSFAKIDGGSGSDTMNLSGNSQTLTLAAVTSALSGIDVIGLGDHGNELVLTSAAISAVSDGNWLKITGGASDKVTLSGTWNYVSQDANYLTIAQSGVTLLVDLDIILVGGPVSA